MSKPFKYFIVIAVIAVIVMMVLHNYFTKQTLETKEVNGEQRQVLKKHLFVIRS